MKKALVLMSAVLFLALSASAAPCVPASSVLTPGFSCTFQTLTFSNFSLVNAGGAPASTMDLVSFAMVNSEIILNFNPSLQVAPGGVADEWFYFQVDGGIIGIDLSVGGLGGSITERACLTPIDPNAANNCTGGMANQLAVLVNTSGLSPVRSPLFPVANRVYLFKDILLQGPTNSSAELSAFSQSFTVPEPMTMVLFGSGLLALGLVRRFRR